MQLKRDLLAIAKFLLVMLRTNRKTGKQTYRLDKVMGNKMQVALLCLAEHTVSVCCYRGAAKVVVAQLKGKGVVSNVCGELAITQNVVNLCLCLAKSKKTK